MKVMLTEEQRSHSERMAKHWPRTIQEYWRQEQERQTTLPSKLLSEWIKVDSRQSMTQKQFSKRKCYRTPSLSHRALIKRVG